MNFILKSMGFVLFLVFIHFSIQARELLVGMAEFPPFKYLEAGKAVGSDTEIVQEVIRLMGHSSKIEVAPWARVQHEALAGKYDLIYSFTKTEEREKLYYFSDPINTVEDVFYKRKTDSISWNTLSDLFQYTLGVSNGYKYAPVLNEAIEQKKFKKIKVESGESEIKNLMNLASRETDIFICEVSVCQYHLLSNIKMLEIKDKIDYINKPVGEIRAFRVGFPKNLKDGSKDAQAAKLRDEFNSQLAKLPKVFKDGVYKKYNIKSEL